MTGDDERRARFEEAARAVWQPLHAYVARRAPRDGVDDIVSETLTVLWRRLDDVPPGAELPWAYSVARRTLANHRRGDGRRTRLVDRVVRRTRTTDLAAPAVDDTVDGDGRVAAALAQLPADDVELLRLWAWEQLEPREIAVVVGAGANAVSARLTRARRRLGELLDEPRHDRGTAGHIASADHAEPSR